MKLSPQFLKKLINIGIPIGLFSIAIVWKLFFINHRDLCLDEPFTLFHSQKSIADIIKLSVQGEPNPPLFMLLLHFWIKVTGIGTVAVRLLPLLLNGLTVFYIYFIGKRFFSVFTGILASGFFLLSNFHFFHGLEVRTYSLLSLAVAAALYYYLRMLKEPDNWKIILALILSNLALVYSHHFGWFVIFMEFLCGFLYLKDKKAIRSILITIGISAVAYIPFFVVLIKQFLRSSQGTWVEAPGSGMEYFYRLYGLLNHRQVFRAVLLVLGAGTIFTIYKRSFKSLPRELLVLFLWWFVPYTIMFAISFNIPMFITRYLLFNSIGLYLFIAAAIFHLFNQHKIIVPAIGLALLGLMGSRMNILPDSFSFRDAKKAIDFIKNQQQPDDAIIIYYAWYDVAFAYYYDRTIFQDTKNFNQRLAQKHIFPVREIEKVEFIVERDEFNRIIYYLDGVNQGSDRGIFDYLSQKYVLTNNVLFPQTINVAVFEKESPQSDKN